MKINLQYIFVFSKKIFKFASLFAFTKWHRGRVARQSSAKACTAVRIRSMPHKIRKTFCFSDFFIVRHQPAESVFPEVRVP